MNQIIVRIDRYFKYPNIMQQTPSGEGKWLNYRFTEDKVTECDYLVILDYPAEDIDVKVNPDNVIHMCMEPPNEMSKYRQYANSNAKHRFNQIYTGRGSIQSHGALPWHLNKSYDFLKSIKVDDLNKEKKIGWVTSNQKSTKGHIQRMNFLNKIKDVDGIEIYGRGIKPLNDKWEVLSKCMYGIAYENYSSPYYWTEKIIDCYLSYAMPIYIGSNTISNYFPVESYIQINPESDSIVDQLKEIISSNRWVKNIEAIRYARQLVLDKYQLFPFLVSYINYLEAIKGEFSIHQKNNIKISGGENYFDNYPMNVVAHKTYYKFIKKLKRRLSINS